MYYSILFEESKFEFLFYSEVHKYEKKHFDYFENLCPPKFYYIHENRIIF